MTASTISNKHDAYYGRVNENRSYGGWCTKTATDRTDYLQVDMGAVHSVCAVSTQGQKYGHYWITSYKVHLSTDGVTWKSYKEDKVEKVTKIICYCLDVEVYREIMMLSDQTGQCPILFCGTRYCIVHNNYPNPSFHSCYVQFNSFHVQGGRLIRVKITKKVKHSTATGWQRSRNRDGCLTQVANTAFA